MNTESNALVNSLLAKLEEQIDRAQHLISLIPQEKLEWAPLTGSQRVADLLGHLLECLAGFCAALYAVNPERLAHFVALKALPVNHPCSTEEAGARIRDYLSRIREGFALLNDDGDLSRQIPTVFVPGGETVMTILLGNLEHLINHKHQLFLYLRMLGVNVATGDLYKLRQQ